MAVAHVHGGFVDESKVELDFGHHQRFGPAKRHQLLADSAGSVPIGFQHRYGLLDFNGRLNLSQPIILLQIRRYVRRLRLVDLLDRFHGGSMRV